MTLLYSFLTFILFNDKMIKCSGSRAQKGRRASSEELFFFFECMAFFTLRSSYRELEKEDIDYSLLLKKSIVWEIKQIINK